MTEKPEILFARLDVKEVMAKVEELHPPVKEEEPAKDENVIDIEPKPEITLGTGPETNLTTAQKRWWAKRLW